MIAFVFLQSVMGQKQYQPVAGQDIHNPHPLISDIVSAINKDSLAAHMQWMVNMGTRFMYAENHREVASMIASKFRSYGYTDVALDSFRVIGETVPGDSVWQYNVVASSIGLSAPGEIYIISAHHDNYRMDDPHMQIPGADDNASGCAVVLEIARVLKAKGFQNAATIRFVTYAAEELVGYVNYSGSIHYAEKIKASGEDLRLDINNDMVAWAKDTTKTIFGSAIPDPCSGWAGDLMLASASMYASSLKILRGQYPTSDSYWFYQLGYPVTGFEEFGLNPTYHTVNDSVNKCDMDICLNVARASCAILLNEQLTPIPQRTTSISGKSAVNLSWQPTANGNSDGFRIYRSTLPDAEFALIGQTTAWDSGFTDTTANKGKLYYYYVASIDHLQFESIRTNIVKGALAPKDRELLVVKDSKGGFSNPSDSAVIAAYRQIFRDHPYDLSDASVIDSLNLVILGRYQRIFWLSNTFSNQSNSSFRRNYKDVTTYLRSGGQLFLNGFQPTFMISGNKTLNKTWLPTDTLWQYYKIQQVLRDPASQLNGATPAAYEFDSIHIDPMKCPSEPVGYVSNLECIHPSPDAKLIYRFNSGYDTTSVLGKMKGKPVGIEYLGDDFKVIVLSVPLYYMDSLDAKTLADLVLFQKFISHVGTEENNQPVTKLLNLRNFPNPFQETSTLEFFLSEGGQVHLSVFNVLGEKILSLEKEWLDQGFHTISLKLGNLQKGFYIGYLISGNFSGSVIMVK